MIGFRVLNQAMLSRHGWKQVGTGK
ncbi:hypothetical protein A2U01_0072151, partial [Trifolium medium]|nr:hypothetical protein [Trifolium medium]